MVLCVSVRSAPCNDLSLPQAHTIVLLQPNPNPSSRTFMDYNTVAEAIDGKIPFIDARFSLLLRIWTQMCAGHWFLHVAQEAAAATKGRIFSGADIRT